MDNLIDLDQIQHSLKQQLCRDVFMWFEYNLSQEKLDIFTEDFMDILYQAIYYDERMFKLYVFDNLKMIDLDLNLKRILYVERIKNFNYGGGK